MKWLWFLLAWVCFALGIIGAFLPVLPTTPFLLLSAFLFSKSSPRFHAWLLSLPLAGPSIRDWQDRRVIRPRAKVLCTAMILVSLGATWAYGTVMVPVKVFLTLLLVSVGTFVVTRKGQ